MAKNTSNVRVRTSKEKKAFVERMRVAKLARAPAETIAAELLKPVSVVESSPSRAQALLKKAKAKKQAMPVKGRPSLAKNVRGQKIGTLPMPGAGRINPTVVEHPRFGGVVSKPNNMPVVDAAPQTHTMARSYLRSGAPGKGKVRNGTYQCTVSFTEAQMKQVVAAAQFRGVSLAEMIRSCVVQHLNPGHFAPTS